MDKSINKRYEIEKDWITDAGMRAIVIITLYDDGNRRHRCGYVGVTKDHPAYKVGYSDPLLEYISQEQVDNTTIGEKSSILILTATCNSEDEFNKVRRSLDILIDCHGGLTYSSSIENGSYPVESDLWWFGFDCAHYLDTPITPSKYDLEYDRIEGTAKTLNFCIKQCESIAKQLKEIK